MAMKTSIQLPVLRLESVEAVARANGYIEVYSKDSEILTVDALDKIFDEYDGNVLKYLELASTLVQHVVRNSVFDLYEPVADKVQGLLVYLQPEEITSAINTLMGILRYVDSLPSNSSNKYLQTEFRLFLDQQKLRSGTPVKQDDSVSMETLFNGMTGTDIHFSALLDAMLEMCQEFKEEALKHEQALLTESLATTVRKVKDKVTNTVVRWTMADKEMSERLNEKFNRYLGDYKDSKKLNAYDKIVKNTFNLSKLLKNLIGSSIIALFIPGGIQVKLVSSVIMLLIKFGLDKRSEDKHKQIILGDLKFEKTVLEEKLKDAETKGDTKAKYQLMRVSNEVARAVDRIQYGLAQE
jgi:hypothetical protein